MIQPMVDAAGISMSTVYTVVGTLVIMNLGAVGTGLVFIIKLVWIAAKYDSRIERMERDINRAFLRVKEVQVEMKENYGE